MQPDPEVDQLAELLREEYAASPLDDEFSSDLVSRLQAEVALPTAPARTRKSPLTVWLSAAVVAAVVVGIVWGPNLRPRQAKQEQLVVQATTDPEPLPRRQLSIVDRNEQQEPAASPVLEEEERARRKSRHGEGAANGNERLEIEHLVEAIGPRILESERQQLAVERRSLAQEVAEAKVIVVAKALAGAPAPPKRPGDSPEHLITFEVMRLLKGKLADEVITTQTPTDAKEFIGLPWIVLLSPEYVAGKSRYAGVYTIKVEPQVLAILADKP